MSSNSFLLAGNASYWTNQFPGTGAISTPAAIRFAFESFANTPKTIRLSLAGSSVLTAVAAGDWGYVCDIPVSALPEWAKPRVASSGGGSTILAGQNSAFSLTSGVVYNSNGPALRIYINGRMNSTVVGATPYSFNSPVGYYSV